MNCPACGHGCVHSEGGWYCFQCDWDLQLGSKSTRRHERRYKKVIRRLDKIGARLAGIR